jgi:predicted DNA-binding transcriptional regulator AlpA
MALLVELEEGELLAVSVPEAARRCSLSVSFLWKLIQEGNGPPLLKIGRRTLVPMDGLQTWLVAHLRGRAQS